MVAGCCSLHGRLRRSATRSAALAERGKNTRTGRINTKQGAKFRNTMVAYTFGFERQLIAVKSEVIARPVKSSDAVTSGPRPEKLAQKYHVRGESYSLLARRAPRVRFLRPLIPSLSHSAARLVVRASSTHTIRGARVSPWMIEAVEIDNLFEHVLQQLTRDHNIIVIPKDIWSVPRIVPKPGIGCLVL